MTAPLLVVGISHRDAGVDLREAIHLDPEGRARVREALGSTCEVVALSTCNRTEVYVAGAAVDAETVVAALLGPPGTPPRREAARVVFTRRGDEVARHLFRVAAGLESVVLGEPEILGQVRSAWLESQRDGRSGPVLNALFQRALETGRRVRSETHLARRPASVASAAIELAARSAGDLAGKNVLVLGAGSLARAVCSAAARRGAQLTLAARNPLRAAETAGARAAVAHLDELERLLPAADVVIAATSAPEPLVSRAAVERAARPLVVLDLGMPRNVETAAGEVAGCRLYDVDDLRLVVEATLASRARASRSAERLLERDLARLADWLVARELRAEIEAARARADELRRRELTRLLAEAGPAAAASAASLEKAAAQHAGRFLHREIHLLKTSRAAA